jgi:hypothetical protein
MLSETGIKILPLFLFLLPSKNLVRVLQMVELGVRVPDADINNGIGAAGKQRRRSPRLPSPFQELGWGMC